MAPLAGKKHSKLDKKEVTQGLNQLYTSPSFAKNPGSCIDIIAVPGLGSDMTRTWMTKNIHWLRDENMLQKVVPEARISVYGYRSQWYGPDAVQEARISSIADDLLHYIHLDRQGKNSKRPIIFVSHSLGGLVVAKAVSEAKRRPEDYPGIFSCITSSIFLGTPFRGSDAQQFAQLVGMAGDIMGPAKYTDLIRSLKASSIELDDLANDFLGDSRQASIDIVCYYETEKTMAKPEWDIGKIFKTGVVIASKKSSTFEGYPNFPWARTHTQMNKFEGPKDVQYKDLAGTLKEMSQKAFKLMKRRQDSRRQDYLSDSRIDRIMEGLKVIDSKKDLSTIRSVQGNGPSWIQEHTEYCSWKESQTHQILWVSGSPGMGKTKIAISTVDDLSKLAELDPTRDDSPALAYFFCDEQDRDRSKAINVLKTLIWQLLKAKRFLARHFFTNENKSKNTHSANAFEFHTLGELWKCLKAALCDCSLGTVYFLVSSLDQIDSELRKEFLNLITSWQPPVMNDEDGSGPVIKWFFLSVPRPDIQEALQDAVRINLDDGSNSANQNNALRKLVAEKVGKISTKKGYSRSLEYFAKTYISFRAEGKSNLDWVNLVCLELEYDGVNYSSIRHHLESLPSDLGPMYDQLSKRVLNGPSRTVEFSKEILRCLLLVHTPPTLYELAVIAGLPEEDRSDEEAIKGHMQHCGAFTQIFDDDDDKTRVQLSYNSVRDFLKSKTNDWLSMPSEQIQHGIISLRCFEYVLAAVRKATALNHKQHDAEAQQEEDEDDDGEEESTEAAEQNVETENDEGGEGSTKAEEGNEENQEVDQDDTVESDEHVVLEAIPTNNESEEPILIPLDYPYAEWIEHALEATPDIVESFGLEDVFWALGSEERAVWSKFYSNLNGEEEFDVNFTALHIAAYFGYVPLADLLLRNEGHVAELGIADSNGHQPLYWACRRGDINMVQKLCDQGADINGGQAADTTTAITPLHGAASSGDIEIVEYLLNKGANIDVPNTEYGTALYIAAENEFLPIVQLLLNRGADPNTIGGDQLAPLNAASLSGNLELVQLLVSGGSTLNPEIEYPQGNAVGVAAFYGNLEVVKYLLEKGCRFDVGDSDGEYPLSLAARENYPDIVKLLLKYDKRPESHDQALMTAVEGNRIECLKVIIERCPVLQRTEPFKLAARNGLPDILNVLTNSGVSAGDLNGALYEAADYQHIETVSLLLDMHADPNAEGEEYGNALQAAAFNGTTEIIKILLARNADPNRVYGDETFGTALQAAAFQGSLENVTILVEAGALINAPKCGRYGNPLQAACCANSEEVVSYLLERGADVNAFGGTEWFPILAATKFGYAEIVDILLKHNSDINVRDSQKSTPLINAASVLPRSYIQMLVEEHKANIHDYDEDGDTAFIMAAACDDIETVEYLLDKGSDIERIGKLGGALYRTTLAGSLETMKFLLDRGINVNQEGGDMQTALQVAANHGNIDEVNLLLEHKADVNIKGGRYHTALQAAVGSGDEEIVQLLLDRGANVNDLGGKYGSPLHAAVRIGNLALVDVLLDNGADISAVNNTNGSILALASRRASTELVVHLIERGGDVNLRGGKYDTALQVACYMESMEEATMFLEHGADPTVEGGFYGSPLGAAASRGNVELIQLLFALEKKPSQQIIDEALLIAVHYRQADAVKFLLENGADVSAKHGTYASMMDALETAMSSEELAQNDYTGDNDEAEDGVAENSDDSDDQDGDGDGDGDGDTDNEDDDGDNDSDSTAPADEDADANKAEAIAVYQGIKEMLTKALQALEPPTQIPAAEETTPDEPAPPAEEGLEVLPDPAPIPVQKEHSRFVQPFPNSPFGPPEVPLLLPLTFDTAASDTSFQAPQPSPLTEHRRSSSSSTYTSTHSVSSQPPTALQMPPNTFNTARAVSIQAAAPYTVTATSSTNTHSQLPISKFSTQVRSTSTIPSQPPSRPETPSNTFEATRLMSTQASTPYSTAPTSSSTSLQRPISTQTQSASAVPSQTRPGPTLQRKPIARKPAPVLSSSPQPIPSATNPSTNSDLPVYRPPSQHAPSASNSSSNPDGAANQPPPYLPPSNPQTPQPTIRKNSYPFNPESYAESTSNLGLGNNVEIAANARPAYDGSGYRRASGSEEGEMQRPVLPRQNSSDLSVTLLKGKWKKFIS